MQIGIRSRGGWGNQMFQKCAAEVISILYGHKIFGSRPTKTNLILTDDLWNSFVEEYLKGESLSIFDRKNVWIKGYCQNTSILNPFRLDIQRRWSKLEWWDDPPSYMPGSNDLVIHLRLGNFNFGGSNSQSLHPNYYLNLLDELSFENLVIVCENPIRYGRTYLILFKKHKPILIHGSLIGDFNTLRHAKRFILSNSTFAWIAAFLGQGKELWLPKFRLGGISETICHQIDEFSFIDITTL